MKQIQFETLKGLPSRQGGLSTDEASRQLERHGPNEIVEVVGNPWLELARDTLKDPMIWLLLGIGSIFATIGETTNAIVLFVAILPLLLMDAFLHWRTQASTSSLKGQLMPTVLVFRDDQERILDAREVVPGDLLSIKSGEFISADGILEDAVNLQVDESALTGEAFAILKKPTSLHPFKLSEAGETAVHPETLGFAGTRLLTGHGHLRVLFTGRNTLYGEIVQSVAGISHERTPLQLSIARLVRALIFASLGLCLLLAGVRLYQGYGWLDALMSAATLAVAALPEEFPVVFSFFLGVGVYRLAKRGALVRRAVSVENIGRVTQICTDKTGTITVGNLTLTHLDPAVGISSEELLRAASAASNPKGTDPVDLAIEALSKEQGKAAYTRLKTFPFTEDRRFETALIKASDGTTRAYIKGSPETILTKSTLSKDDLLRWKDKTRQWAKEGHKVLACGTKPITAQSATKDQEPVDGFTFLGLLAFEDPPRPEVAPALDYCRKNGIHVLMITGDHPDTASAIAKDIGLGGTAPVVLSAEENPEKFNPRWLLDNPGFLKSLSVAARCTPIQKLNIVQALKSTGEVVAVTGDGVNDVPALKAADIGISMGKRGTRSAKEVSAIVLLDDNFSSIVHAILEGRQLFLNLKMSFEYLLLIHIALILTAGFIPLFGYPIPYLPINIVWLELIIHPTALFAFQERASQKDIPALEKAGIFSTKDGIRFFVFGVLFTALMVTAFVHGLSGIASPDHARTQMLALLTVLSAGLVFAFTGYRTRSALVISLGTVLSTYLFTEIPLFSNAQNLTPLRWIEWGAILGSVVVFLGLFRFSKLLFR